MRSRTNAVEDSFVEADPQQQTLAQVVAILMPVRERRTLSLDSQCRDAQRCLADLQQAIGHAERNCQDEAAEQQRQRSALTAVHQGQVMSANGVLQWHRQEKTLMNRQAELRLQVQRLSLELDDQQQLVNTARERLLVSQRALERLACWRDALT